MGISGEPLNLGSREDLDRVAGAHLDDRLLPAGLRALEGAAALRLRLHLDDVDADDLDVEELLDGLAHLRLVRVGMDTERVLVLPDVAVALLRDDGREQDFVGMEAHDALRWRASRESSVTRSARAQPISATAR